MSLESQSHLNGVLLLDKPMGYTSQQAVSEVKRLFHSKKAGHTGSLDPIATGLLPICLGEATKFSQYLLGEDKHYQVAAKLGQRTNTGDTEGHVIEKKPVPALSFTQLESLVSEFVGHILQVPPMFSALKHQGKPLYHWARQGKSIERKPRPITIHSLTLLSYESNYFNLEVRCSKGTYIRSLIDDIGVKIGCGAHLTSLRRLSVGQYSIMQSLSLQDLGAMSTTEERTNHLLPLEQILPKDWPVFYVSEPAAFYLRRGQALYLPKTPKAEWIRLFLKTTNQCLGIAQILKDGKTRAFRLVND